MDLKDLATKLVMSKIGGANDSGATASALENLVGDGDKFDLAGLVGKFTGSGGDLAEKAKSWLGDGDNASLSPAQVQDAIGLDKIESFAEKLGIGREEASSKLSEIVPDLIDKSSQGGSLLDSVGGVSGLKGLASKFFR
ncbi:MAG: DUF937 domain-containing protein [Woeseiaceae bacterium]|nr:DUF937 domain-containing protein [Woeseiaceae bacterium]